MQSEVLLFKRKVEDSRNPMLWSVLSVYRCTGV